MSTLTHTQLRALRSVSRGGGLVRSRRSEVSPAVFRGLARAGLICWTGGDSYGLTDKGWSAIEPGFAAANDDAREDDGGRYFGAVGGM